METINMKKLVTGSMDEVIDRLTEALKAEGFGILTRIDFDQKIREKLGEEMRPVVILGACNPKLAFEAYKMNPDVTGLLPCNAVVREMEQGKASVELIKPTSMMEALKDKKLTELSKPADEILEKVLKSL